MVQELSFLLIIFSSIRTLFHQLEEFVKSLNFLIMHSCCLCQKIFMLFLDKCMQIIFSFSTFCVGYSGTVHFRVRLLFTFFWSWAWNRLFVCGQHECWSGARLCSLLIIKRIFVYKFLSNWTWRCIDNFLPFFLQRIIFINCLISNDFCFENLKWFLGNVFPQNIMISGF